jgi:hypothetical protein
MSVQFTELFCHIAPRVPLSRICVIAAGAAVCRSWFLARKNLEF